MPYSETETSTKEQTTRPVDSNRIVHGLWIGARLSRMELLTLHSFTRFGHHFHLWVYDDLETPIPVGVSLRDANEILPRERAFVKTGNDAEVGLGKDSYAPFSDLFRYKLLYEHGGIWVDMDVSCHRPFDFSEPYVFRAHPIGMIGNVMKVPARSDLMRSTFEEVDAVANSDVAWLTPNRILNKNVSALGLAQFIRSDISNVDRWTDGVRPFAEGPAPIPDEWYCIHWMNEAWKAMQAENGAIGGRRVVDYTPSKDEPFSGSTLRELYRFYGLIDPRSNDGMPFPSQKQSQNHKEGMRLTNWYQQPLPMNAIAVNLARPDMSPLVDTINALSMRKRSALSLQVIDHVSDELVPVTHETCQIYYRKDHDIDRFLRQAAMEIVSSPVPAAYTFGLRSAELKTLRKLGVVTIPVIEKAQPDWSEAAELFHEIDAPFLLAGSDSIADELRESGCGKTVITLRHEVVQRYTPELLMRGRQSLRQRYGIDDNTVLIGMSGAFKSQMAYTRAIRVLSALQQRCPAKLMILGKWGSGDGKGRRAYVATMRQAIEAGVIADVIVVSGGEELPPFFGAFDVFLNTSVYEGLNLAIQEAILAGCPVVAADVGGNREIISESANLVESSSDADAYAEAILSVLGRRERIIPGAPIEADLVARIRSLLLRHGIEHIAAPALPANGTLFITANLHIGGPSRSLTNLLTCLSGDTKTLLCVVGGVSVPRFREAIEQAQVPLLSTESIAELSDRVEQILIWIDQFNVKSVCFWSVPPEIKLLLTKILYARNINLVDVSPGPMLFDELAAAAPFQKRISLSTAQYIERLDHFVSLYREGTTEHALGLKPRASDIIPLGVPLPPRFIPLPPPEAMTPARFDPRFAIGTCCRVVPDKKVEFLFDMMKLLVRKQPLATLTIVGGPDRQSMDYWEGLLRRVRDERLDFVHFAGRHDDVNPFLSRFKVFVMVSERQGCPNASLEAMAMKRPVVANPSGGTSEQIINGINGYLVESPEEMADRVAELLADEGLAQKMGRAGYKIVTERFGMAEMVKKYENLLM